MLDHNQQNYDQRVSKFLDHMYEYQHKFFLSMSKIASIISSPKYPVGILRKKIKYDL